MTGCYFDASLSWTYIQNMDHSDARNSFWAHIVKKRILYSSRIILQVNIDAVLFSVESLDHTVVPFNYIGCDFSARLITWSLVVFLPVGCLLDTRPSST